MAGEGYTIGVLLDETGGSIKTGPFGTKLKASEYTASGVPVISVGEVGFGRLRIHIKTPRVDETVWSRMPEFLLKAGDIVFGRKGAVERSAQIHPEEEGYFLGSDGIRIRLSSDVCDPKFIAYQLLTREHKEWMIQHAAGTTMPSLNEGIIRRIPIILPPLPTQKAIAHILGTLDDLIELNRETNEILEAMARALFQSWFVDFDPVRAKLEGRAPAGMDAATAALFPALFQDSELGQIPWGWEVGTLGSVLDTLETGRRPKGGVAGYACGVPSVGAESINGIGVFDYSKTKFIPQEFYDKTKSGRIQNLDVLLYKDGGKPGEFRPRVGLFGYGFPFDEFCINEHVFRMRADSVGQHYLYFAISDERVLLDFANKGGKAAIPGINQTDVRSTHILIPPKPVLEAFEKMARPMCQTIIENAVESRDLAALRDTLLPKLLSGELSVADALADEEKIVVKVQAKKAKA
jgi:type I restriction enzyme S subunit